MTAPTPTPAEQWHATSDHGKDGEPFDGPLCNCQSAVDRASALGWNTRPDAARARQALADAAEVQSINMNQRLTARAGVFALLAIAEALSRQPDDVVAVADSTSSTEKDDLPTGRHPEPVKPSREDVARVLATDLHHFTTADAWGLIPEAGRDYWRKRADAVLALWPGRSAAEVKAEALREFTARVCSEMAASDAALGKKWADKGYRQGLRSALRQADDQADRIERGES